MKKNYFIFSCLLIYLFSLSGCSDDSTVIEEVASSEISSGVKNLYDDWFDLDNITKLKMRDPSSDKIYEYTLPWANGAANAFGIPREWIDYNWQESSSKRKYTTANGWYLVYSNLLNNDSRKYFALYNKYNGVLRIFYYMYSNSSTAGTSHSFWGINVEGTSSILGFTSGIATDMSKRVSNPLFVTTPQISLNLSSSTSGTTNGSKGYVFNNWYAIELECAYDSNLSTSANGVAFGLNSWAMNVTQITGSIQTKGTVSGTIQSTSSGGGNTINISDIFSSNNSKSVSSIIVNQEGIINQVGADLDSKIKSGDTHSKNLWNSIKSKVPGLIENGAKKGLESIFTSGASSIGDALQGIFNSLLGGTSQPSISKVDLQIATVSQVNLESSITLPGWGTVNGLIIPGTISDSHSSKPLYNKPLGVWNLRETPKLKVDIMHNRDRSNPKSDMTSLDYSFVSVPQIILNPVIATDFVVSDYEYSVILFDSKYPKILGNSSTNPVLVNGKAAYAFPRGGGFSYSYYDYPGGLLQKKGVVMISFKLKNKKTGQIQTYFSRSFEANLVKGKEETKWYIPSNPGEGPIGPVIEM